MPGDFSGLKNNACQRQRKENWLGSFAHLHFCLMIIYIARSPLNYRQHMGKAEKLGVVALPGPHDGSCSVPNEPGRDGSECEPAAMLRQNRVPGHDSRIGYTFTPGVAPPWLMTEMQRPEEIVNEVKSSHLRRDASNATVPLAPPFGLVGSCREPETPSSLSGSLSITRSFFVGAGAHCRSVLSTAYGVAVHRRNAITPSHDTCHWTPGGRISSALPHSSLAPS